MQVVTQGRWGGRVQVAATCKHFLGYSMELAEGFSRHNFNAKISERWRVCSLTK